MSFDVIAEGPDDRIGILPVAEAKILPPFTGVIPPIHHLIIFNARKKAEFEVNLKTNSKHS